MITGEKMDVFFTHMLVWFLVWGVVWIAKELGWKMFGVICLTIAPMIFVPTAMAFGPQWTWLVAYPMGVFSIVAARYFWKKVLP